MCNRFVSWNNLQGKYVFRCYMCHRTRVDSTGNLCPDLFIVDGKGIESRGLQMGDAQHINTLPRERHGLAFFFKTTREAQDVGTHGGAVDTSSGIEAFRTIRFNLFRKDSNPWKENSDGLTARQPIKTSEMRTDTARVTAWGDELSTGAKLDAECTLGIHQGRQIPSNALASDVRETLDREEA